MMALVMRFHNWAANVCPAKVNCPERQLLVLFVQSHEKGQGLSRFMVSVLAKGNNSILNAFPLHSNELKQIDEPDMHNWG